MKQPPQSTEPPAPSLGVSQQSIRSGTPSKGKASSAPQDTSSPSNIAQLRSELAQTQKTRGELETKLSSQNAELETLKAADQEQQKRIAQLEKVKENLERRVKDRADELKGKGRFVEEVQDEMVALNLQLNMAEQEKEKLKKENEELTRRWVQKMEQEATTMNDKMGWKDGRRK